MRRVRTRLTVCTAALAVSTTLGLVAAPAASADEAAKRPGPPDRVLEHLRGTSSIVPSTLAVTPPFGRKL